MDRSSRKDKTKKYDKFDYHVAIKCGPA